jgi:hypothetical protein
MQFLFENLVKQSRVLTEGRKEDARERYPDINERVFNVFVNEDPSGNHKYLMWIAGKWDSEYGNNYYGRDVSTAGDFMENVTYFHNQNQKFEKKDINQYGSIEEFKRAVTNAKTELSKGEIKQSAKRIFEDGTHLVVQPTTHAASCFYGAGTRWCTTSKNYPRHYINYTKSGTLFYYINKRNGKKRAFYTKFNQPFLTPSAVSGDRHDRLGSTQVYTETDNRGRSLRGIPVPARQAMNAEHQKGLDNYIKSLSKEEELVYRLQNGLELPEGYTTHVGDWSYNMSVPQQITKIEGNYNGGYRGSLGNVKEITGDVVIDSYMERVEHLETVGGDFTTRGGWRNGYLTDIGPLKRVGGTFTWNKFTSLPKSELEKLESVGRITATPSQISELSTELRVPGLPNTKVRL